MHLIPGRSTSPALFAIAIATAVQAAHLTAAPARPHGHSARDMAVAAEEVSEADLQRLASFDRGNRKEVSDAAPPKVAAQLARSRKRYRTLEAWRKRQRQIREEVSEGRAPPAAAGKDAAKADRAQPPRIRRLRRREHRNRSDARILLHGKPVPAAQAVPAQPGHSLPARTLQAAGAIPRRTLAAVFAFW